MIDGQTDLYGVVGDPIAHTQSPALHNAWFQEVGRNAVYLPFHIRPDGFEAFLKGARGSNLKGLNVTLPYKEKAFALCEETTAIAQAARSVNTLLFHEGRLLGHTTDGAGFLKDIQEKAPQVSFKKSFVFGAGGIGRLLAVVLIQQGAEELYLVNRTRQKAEVLKEYLQKISQNTRIKVLDFKEIQKKQDLQGATFLVNGTSLGLEGRAGFSVAFEKTAAAAVVYDTIYTPAQTLFLKGAQKAGRAAFNGGGMLAAQARFSWDLFMNPQGFFAQSGRAVF